MPHTLTTSQPGRRGPHVRRRLLGTAGVLVLSLVAAGCSGGSEKPSSTGQARTLTIASWQFTQPNDTLWPIMQTFTKDHPDVKLEKQAVPLASYPSTIKTQLGARSGPDIIVSSDVDFYQLARSGLLEPLNDVKEAIGDAKLRPSNTEAEINGTQFGLIWVSVNYAFFWNKKLLAEAGVEPPTDFQSFLSAAKQVHDKTGAWGYAGRHQLNEETPWYQDFASTFLPGFGGAWSKDGKLTINTPQNVQAVTALKQIHDSGAMLLGDDASTFRQKFAQGQIAMMLDNQGAVEIMVKNNNTVTRSDIGSGRPPFPDGTVGHQYVYITINKHSQNKDLAKEYLKWLYSAGTQEKLAASFAPREIGTTVDIPAEYRKDNPWTAAFSELLRNSKSPVISGHESDTPKVAHVIMPEIAAVLAGRKTPAEALASADRAAQQAISGP